MRFYSWAVPVIGRPVIGSLTVPLGYTATGASTLCLSHSPVSAEVCAPHAEERVVSPVLSEAKDDAILFRSFLRKRGRNTWFKRLPLRESRQ